MFAVRLITARRRGANTGEQARKDVTGRGAALLPVRRSWPPGTPSVTIRRRRDRGAGGQTPRALDGEIPRRPDRQCRRGAVDYVRP